MSIVPTVTELYKKKCDSFLAELKTTYPNRHFIIDWNYKLYDSISAIMRVKINSNTSLVVDPKLEWDGFKKLLDKQIAIVESDNPEARECFLCRTNGRVCIFCQKCHNNYCILCHFKLLQKGKGVIKCPFCRALSGKETTDKEVECIIEKIKLQFPQEFT